MMAGPNRLLPLLKTSSPLLVASLDGEDLSTLLEQARTERVDVVEIRMDLWGTFLRHDLQAKLERYAHKMDIPLLITFRGGDPFPSWWEPLHWRALAPAAMIDVEWNPKYPWKEISQQAKRHNLGLMISHHDFKRTPSESAIVSIGKKAFAKKADVFKVATHTTRAEDLRALVSARQRLPSQRPVAFMGMGPMGPVSRLVAPLYNSCLVYGYLGSPTASGQLLYRDLRDQIKSLFPTYDQQFQKRQSKPQEVLS